MIELPDGDAYGENFWGGNGYSRSGVYQQEAVRIYGIVGGFYSGDGSLCGYSYGKGFEFYPHYAILGESANGSTSLV